MNVSCSSKESCCRQFRSLFSIIIVSCRVGKIITRFTCRCSSLKTWIADIVKLHSFSVPDFFSLLYLGYDMKIVGPVPNTKQHRIVISVFSAFRWTDIQAIVASGTLSCGQLWDSFFKGHRHKPHLSTWVAVPKPAALCLRHTTGTQIGLARLEGTI